MSGDERVTERDMLDLLRARYSATKPGNGPRYAIAEQVRSAAGFDARRSADMIVMDLWPGDGRGSRLSLIGHEVKVSRSDWLSELRDPDKSETFKQFMHHWYLVVSDASIVKSDELPEGWGLIVKAGGQLRQKVKAPRLNPSPLPYTMLAPLLRATQNVGRSQGRGEVARFVAERRCSTCGNTIRYRNDGKWEHTQWGSTTCKFPSDDWRNHKEYRKHFRARP